MNATQSLLFNHRIPVRFEEIYSGSGGKIETA
jgi:hypothetical protein